MAGLAVMKSNLADGRVVGEIFERAAGAFGGRFAKVLAGAHEQGVIFVKKFNILRKVRLEQILKL